MQKDNILVTVKTYPTLSKTYGELACTAGLREDGSWVRIYPVPFRRLRDDLRFEKYAWIELPLEKNSKDPRPESYRPTDLSQIKRIEFVNTANEWRERKKLILEKIPCYTDLSELIIKAKNNELSLALFKPTVIDDFIAEPTEREWDKKKLDAVLSQLNQGSLFPQEEFVDDFGIVKKLPYKFYYVFHDTTGKRSKLMIEDWEVGALYRNCFKKYKSEEKALEKVKEKFLHTFVDKHDLYFYLGTTLEWHLRAPNPFVIVGTFSPPKERQTCLDF